MNRYIDYFLSLKCCGDVLNATIPINNICKEITESMAIIRHLKRITLVHPNKYCIMDLCAGNALTSVLAAHMLPIKIAVAIDIKKRKRHFERVRKFHYLEYNIHDIINGQMNFPRGQLTIGNKTILIAVHSCKNLARKTIDIYKTSSAPHLIMMPCCEGNLKNKYPMVIKKKLGHYLTWVYDLSREVDGQVYVDKNCMSPRNAIIVANK